MKKLIIMAVIIVAGVAANAASFKWSAANIYGPDGALANGSAQVFCDALSATALSTVEITSGKISATVFESTTAAAESYYDFYFVATVTSGGADYTFTSATKSGVQALDVGEAAVSFGNMKNATQSSGAWQSAAVPEPTSGLLMLLGMAGLALKRKRA